MVTSFQHCNNVTDQCAASVRSTLGCFFLLSYRLVGVCEIKLSHMGKNSENPDLVWEN